MIEQAFQAEHFINRELSWLEFNARVLEEAEDTTNPLLERVKFLSIFSSNLDEFFMVRVAGLREQAFGDGAPQDYSPDGLRAITQLQRVAKRTQELVAAQYRCWNESVRPQLEQEGIRLLGIDELNDGAARIARPVLSYAGLSDSDAHGDRPQPSQPPLSQPAAVPGGDVAAAAGPGPAQLFAVVQLPRFCRGSCRSERTDELVSCCWKRPSRPAYPTCSADSTRCTGPRSASRATATSSCWSKSRTTCCG